MNWNRIACSLTVLVFAIGIAPQAQALDAEDYKQTRDLWDERSKDEVSSKVKATSSIYTYRPSLYADGKLDSFKIVAGRKTVVSESLQGDKYARIWLVHPLEKLSDKSGRQKIDRDASNVIGKVYSRNANPFVDLNADGKLEVVVGRWTGGAHCCTDYQVYSLGTPSKPWKRIDGQDGSFYFADLDGDKKYEAIGADFTFAYWNTSFAGSPAQTVVLRAEGNKFVLALDLMKLPKPDASTLDKMDERSRAEMLKIKEENKSEGNDLDLNPELWRNMLDLIYSGHSQEAWNVAHKAWPTGKKALFTHDPKNEKSFGPGGPDEFIGAFLGQLKRSPYWEGLKKLNAGDGRLTGENSSKKVMVGGCN